MSTTGKNLQSTKYTVVDEHNPPMKFPNKTYDCFACIIPALEMEKLIQIKLLDFHINCPAAIDIF